MKNKKGKKKTDRIDRSIDSATVTAPVDRGIQMGKAIPSSTLYQGVPEVKTSCNAVVAAAADYGAALAGATAADLAAATARSLRDAKWDTFLEVNAICITTVEHHAASPADIQGVSYTLLIPNNNGLVALDGMLGKYDPVLDLVELRVEHPGGVNRCLIEVSTDPANAASWQRVPGDGLRRKLGGYVPGTYWFRAANMRAGGQSPFTTPISVVVK